MHALSLFFIESLLAFLPFTWADYPIDDANITVTYTNPSKWTHFTSSVAYYNTMSEASCMTSDDCSIEIPFIGSGIIIYGYLYGGPLNFIVSLDGKMAPASGAFPTVHGVYPNYTLYVIQTLSLAPHNLTISLVDSDLGLSMIYFDYAYVNTTAPASGSSAAGSSSATGSSLATGSPPATGASSAAGSSSPAQSASYHSHFPVGAVVGGSLAGLALIAIILAILYLWRKRHTPVHVEVDPEPNHISPTLPDAEWPHTPPSAMAFTPFLSPLDATNRLYPHRSSSFISQQQKDNTRITSPSDSFVSPMHATSTADSTDLHPSIPSTKMNPDNDLTFTQSPASLQSHSGSNQLTDEQADFVNSLHTHNVPAPAIARIVQRMMAGQEIGELDEISTAAGDDAEEGRAAPTIVAPPKYSES